jgi:hypothetical protein
MNGIVAIFDKLVDYKEIYQGNFQIKEEVDLNRIEQSRTRSYRFNSNCNFCQKFGHKAIDCYARKNQLQTSNSQQNPHKNQDNGRYSNNCVQKKNTGRIGEIKTIQINSQVKTLNPTRTTSTVRETQGKNNKATRLMQKLR